MTDYSQTFEKLCSRFRRARLLSSSAELLEWDERTGMPSGAAEYRAEQVAHLTSLAHRERTDQEIIDLLDELADWGEAADTHAPVGATLRLLREDYEKESKLPSDLVQAIARATVRGQGIWDAARKANDFAMFQGALDEMISLQRQAGDCLATDDQTTYEALLDQYEPGARVAHLTNVFATLRDELKDMLSDIEQTEFGGNPSLPDQVFDLSNQRTLSSELAAAIGFDFQRGRLDETSHPFCTGPGPSDCRILTRYDERFIAMGIFGTLHEAGHGLYEQGLPQEWYGLPPGTYASLGIHESQSRLWENLVGRSLAFWQHFAPRMKELFPSCSGQATAEDWYRSFHRVQPSLIRVEADEATYNLHIIIRFELEQALISGELSTSDLPQVWADAYENLLGIRPPDVADGVLQDVHWSAGLFGYFPTYTLGNLAAAQLFDAASDQLGDLDEMFRQGEFATLLQWLRTNIHQHGRCYSPAELIQNATGQALSAKPLIRSLRERYFERSE